MTPKQTATKIEALIQKATDRLNKVIERTQFVVYDSLLLELKKLELDNDGYILQNNANRKIIRGVSAKFDMAVNASGYTSGLNDFVSSLSSIDAINAEYFASVDTSFTSSMLAVKDLQKQTITQIESLLLNDGLESQVKQPLITILNQNVNTGGSYQGLVQQMKDYVLGKEDVDGKLLRYAKQITQDALNNYSRAYQSSAASSLGLEFYAYVGGIMPESREFCRDRVNGYYHYLEIESWASLDWKGKNSLTTKSSIFILAGGYGCLHSICPVSTYAVPKDWIHRAVDLGFYKS